MKLISLFLVLFASLSLLQGGEIPPNDQEGSLPIVAFWFNGGWDHYDPEAIQYLDEVIIFAVAPDPDTGGIQTVSTNEASGVISYRRRSGAGLTTEMIDTLVSDAKKHGVRTTLGINAMGKKVPVFNALVKNNKQDLFAEAVRDLCLKHGIQGVDVDYEHPNSDEDVEILGSIFKALSTALKPHGLHVSGAFGIGREHTRIFLGKYHELLDQVNVMCYVKPVAQVKKMLTELHEVQGVPKHKITGGIGFYCKGRGAAKKNVSWNYRDFVDMTEVTGEEDHFKLPNPDQPDEIIRFNYNNGNESLRKKVAFLKEGGYGGIMIWALNNDLPVSDPRARLLFLHSLTTAEK